MKLHGVEKVVRRSIKKAGQYTFHQVHRAQARQVLRLLQKKYGPPDPANLKLATPMRGTCLATRAGAVAARLRGV